MILGARQAYYEGATEVMKILFMYKRPPGIRTARRARPAMDQPEGAVCRLAVDSYKNAKAFDERKAQYWCDLGYMQR